jgi:hypothetical protein
MAARIRGGLALGLAVLASAGAASPAWAEGEPGVFDWHPSLHVTTVADDNVFFSDDGSKGSVGTWVTPRLEMTWRTPALEVGADVGVDARQYFDHRSALDDEYYRAVGWADIALSPSLRLRISDAYVPQPYALGRPEDGTGNLSQTNRADFDFSWSLPFERGSEIALGTVVTHFWSDGYPETVPAAGGGSVVENDFRSSYVQGLAYGEFRTPLGERTSAFARTQASYRDFTENSDASHANLSLLMGVRSQHWANLEAELSGGVGYLQFSGLGSAMRALGDARLLYRFENGWSVWLSGLARMSPDLSGDDALQTTGEVGVEKRFDPATAAAVRLFATRYAGHLPTSQADLFGAVEVRLRRQLSRRLQVGVTYRHWRNAGAFGADDFDQNLVGVDLGFRM